MIQAEGKHTYSPPELAKRWGVNAAKVLRFIKSGQLSAFDVSSTPGGRPRWRIPIGAVEAFEAKRAAVAPAKPARRSRRRKPSSDIIEFY
jgi:hypothetical protein